MKISDNQKMLLVAGLFLLACSIESILVYLGV